jgi:hypothetical protein
MSQVLTSKMGRYKYTGVYLDSFGPSLGTWMAPPELDTKVASIGAVHVVSSADIGFLDRIAVKYYGDGTEMLWWAVCRVNGIIDPEIDVFPGLKIYVPSVDRVMAYVRGS